MKYCNKDFAQRVVKEINPISEVSVTVNQDDILAMLITTSIASKFFETRLENEEKVDPNAVNFLVGLACTLHHRLKKEFDADKDNEVPFTFLIGELVVVLMVMEDFDEVTHEAIHEKFDTCIPEEVKENLHKKVYDTVSNVLDGKCEFTTPEEEDSLFPRVLLEMIPTVGGIH